VNRIGLDNVNKLTVVIVGSIKISTKNEIPIRKPVPVDDVSHPGVFLKTIK
jgi:hypothetical protein